MSTLRQAPQSGKTKVAVSSTNKKHSLKKAGKVHVPSALLSTASKRPSTLTGAPRDTSARVNTAPAAYGRVGAVEDAAVRVRGLAAESPATDSTTIAQSADVAEMMRMLKTLTAQVEEVRAALVKHDLGQGQM